jgi:hypothetical protein
VGASAWCCIADHSFVSLTILTLQPYTSLSLFLLQLHLDVNRPNVIAHLTNLQFDAYTISSAESNNRSSHLLSHSTHPNNAQAICPERHPFSSPSNQLKFTQHSHSTHLNNAQIVPSTPIVTPVASPTRPASPSFVCVKIECAGAGS